MVKRRIIYYFNSRSLKCRDCRLATLNNCLDLLGFSWNELFVLFLENNYYFLLARANCNLKIYYQDKAVKSLKYLPRQLELSRPLASEWYYNLFLVWDKVTSHFHRFQFFMFAALILVKNLNSNKAVVRRMLMFVYAIFPKSKTNVTCLEWLYYLKLKLQYFVAI